MDRSDIEAYFTRKQRATLKVEMLESGHWRVFRPKIPDQVIDSSPERGAYSLRVQGWSVLAIARFMDRSWYIANKMIELGRKKIESELGMKIEK